MIYNALVREQMGLELESPEDQEVIEEYNRAIQPNYEPAGPPSPPDRPIRQHNARAPVRSLPVDH